MTNNSQKLQKVLAMQGLGSRRAIETWIRQGRLIVNGQIASLGLRVQMADQIQLDGQLLKVSKQYDAATASVDRQVLLYYKPAGEICTRQDPQQRPTIFDRLPLTQQSRWVMIGRLDFNTLGLLLLTTDGELAYRLMHPKYGIEREYAVKLQGTITPAICLRLQRGILLDGKLARFSQISLLKEPEKQPSQVKLSVVEKQASGTKSRQIVDAYHKPQSNLDRTVQRNTQWYRVTLQEGRYREVRRLWASQGINVTRLIRIRFGPIPLPRHLKAGQWVYLPKPAIQTLATCVDLSSS